MYVSEGTTLRKKQNKSKLRKMDRLYFRLEGNMCVFGSQLNCPFKKQPMAKYTVWSEVINNVITVRNNQITSGALSSLTGEGTKPTDTQTCLKERTHIIQIIYRNEFMDLTAWLICLGAVILRAFELYFEHLSIELQTVFLFFTIHRYLVPTLTLITDERLTADLQSKIRGLANLFPRPPKVARSPW